MLTRLQAVKDKALGIMTLLAVGLDISGISNTQYVVRTRRETSTPSFEERVSGNPS